MRSAPLRLHHRDREKPVSSTRFVDGLGGVGAAGTDRAAAAEELSITEIALRTSLRLDKTPTRSSRRPTVKQLQTRSTRCHQVQLGARIEFAELTWDGLGRPPLVSTVRESLRNNEIHPVSDWGSSGRRFNSCQLGTESSLMSGDRMSRQPRRGRGCTAPRSSGRRWIDCLQPSTPAPIQTCARTRSWLASCRRRCPARPYPVRDAIEISGSRS
jgi:hypothetical protein